MSEQQPHTQHTYATTWHCHSNSPTWCWGPVRTVISYYNNRTHQHNPEIDLHSFCRHTNGRWKQLAASSCRMARLLWAYLIFLTSSQGIWANRSPIPDMSGGQNKSDNTSQSQPFQQSGWSCTPGSSNSTTDLNLQRIRNSVRWHSLAYMQKTKQKKLNRKTCMHTYFWGLILPVRSLTANITRAFRNESKDILCFFLEDHTAQKQNLW